MQKNVKAGNFKMSNELDAGWGGEAFGTEKSAMTIEGNWIKGAIEERLPRPQVQAVELPAGPKGKGTLQFTQCWGIAADSKAQAQAVDLVKALSTVDQQMKFAEAFGVMPSRQSAADQYKAKFPEDAPFIAGGEYGHGPINAAGHGAGRRRPQLQARGLRRRRTSRRCSRASTPTPARRSEK